MSSLFTEGWPLFAAIALVAVITWGALRPYLKGTPRQDRKKDNET
ncbi:hypothetical protein [Oceaniglobus trochenteri]|nr:hypothetical protein [Oceaniglobus trochenteri]